MHLFLKAAFLTKCPKCGKPAPPHSVCPNCGFYKGREVIDVMKKLTRKEKKQREKEMKGKEEKESGEKPLSWEELSKK